MPDGPPEFIPPTEKEIQSYRTRQDGTGMPRVMKEFRKFGGKR